VNSSLRSCGLLALILAVTLLGGATAAADASTKPVLQVQVTPSPATPGSIVTITATVTPGTNPDSTGLAVNCDLSWAHLGTSSPLTPDASGLVFSREATVPSDAVAGDRVGSCTVVDDQDRVTSSPYTFTIGDSTPPTNEPPTVSAGGPYTVDEGASVQLIATGTDPENGPLTYAWDLDNDGTYETAGMTPTFSAAALDGPSSHTVGVQATDDGHLTATATAIVTVANVAPTASFDAPAATFAGVPFTLSLMSPHDPSAADTAVGFSYAFDCGSGYGAFGPASTAACSTVDPGTVSVGGQIRDKDGDLTEYRGDVSVTVSSSDLCGLVRAYSTDPKVADDLCAKLAQADAAPTASARAGLLGAFRNQVDAKVGKGLTAEQAAELKLLSKKL
jgi:PKD domain